MGSKTFRSTAYKRAIDVGKITTVGADDLVKIWRTSIGDEKAISLSDLAVGVADGLVPYVGAISDVNLGDHSLLTESITLNPAPVTIPTAQGSMYFDQDEQTLAVILNGVTQKVGEDNFFQVKNQSGATIPKGTAVRFDGVIGASGRIKVVKFIANGSYPSLYFAGVTDEEILNGEDGKAYILGKVRKLNTSAYPIGTILYCSSTVAGGFTTVPPIAPNNIISVAVVIVQSATVGTLLIRPQLGSNINYDEGVKIVSGLANDVLQLQPSGLWENKNLDSQYVTIATAQTITGPKIFNNEVLELSANNPVFRIRSNSNTAGINFRKDSGEDAAGIEMSSPANKFSLLTRVGNMDIEINPHGTGSILLPNVPAGTGSPLLLSPLNKLVKGSGIAVTETTGYFTPIIYDVGGGATYTVRLATGYYVRHGSLVYVEISIDGIETTGTPTDYLAITLPFDETSNGGGHLWNLNTFSGSSLSSSQVALITPSNDLIGVILFMNKVTATHIEDVVFTDGIVRVNGLYTTG